LEVAMRWSLFWVGVVVVLAGYTVLTIKTADDPVVIDGVIQGSHAPATIADPSQSPSERADAFAANLDAAERLTAQDELAAASSALFAARATVPGSRGDILDAEPGRAAAQHRWEIAMERLYGPTWEAHHARTLAETDQAVDGMASRFGYRSR
jgi:hypothetical protein